MLFGKDPVVHREENRQLYRSFLKFNKGKPLAFVESEETNGIWALTLKRTPVTKR